MLEGGRTCRVPAPLDQLPLLVRAGAVLPLLPADVETLSPYGTDVVHLSDRPAQRSLLAWPARGASASAEPADEARVRSGVSRDGSWALAVRQRRRRTFNLQVALPKRPCALLVDGKRRSFSYGDGVLRAAVALTSGTVTAPVRCDGR